MLGMHIGNLNAFVDGLNRIDRYRPAEHGGAVLFFQLRMTEHISQGLSENHSCCRNDLKNCTLNLTSSGYLRIMTLTRRLIMIWKSINLQLQKGSISPL